MVTKKSKQFQKTVFIVGAGASKEVNLPVGAELKESIANVLDFNLDSGQLTGGDSIIFTTLQTVARQGNPSPPNFDHFIKAAWQIRNAMPQAISIDNYIDTLYQEGPIELCGKLAIVLTILQAEKSSKLFIDQNHRIYQLNYPLLVNTWYISFWQLLTENCRLPDLEKRLSSIAHVIFNYDRCIEHFLYYAIQNYYNISATEAAAILQHLEVYHPYGIVGSLPWLSSKNAIEFGEIPSPNQLLILAAQIKTFTEGTDELSSSIHAIRENIATASRLVFLGFAFHRMNLDLLFSTLQSDFTRTNRRMIFATALGISESDINFICSELSKKGHLPTGQITIRGGLSCNDLFFEYRRNLSLI